MVAKVARYSCRVRQLGVGDGSVAVHERGLEKRMLAIESQDPEGNTMRASWGGQCVNCGD